MKEKMQTEQAIKILENTYIIAARRSGKIENLKALALAINALREYEEGYERAKKYFERLTGKWIFKHNSSNIWCSVCDEDFDEIPQKYNYCPNCGAKMKGADND